jgi:hypothetical protein
LLLPFSWIKLRIHKRERGNPLTYHKKLSSQSIQRKKLHQNWMKNKNSIYPPNIWNFRVLTPFWNKIAHCFYGPSITHKDNHFAKIKKINIWNFSFLGHFYVKTCNSYIIMLCDFLKVIIQWNSLQKLEKKCAPTLDNYGQSCFVRSDF